MCRAPSVRVCDATSRLTLFYLSVACTRLELELLCAENFETAKFRHRTTRVSCDAIAMLFVLLLNLLTAVTQPNDNEVDGDSSHRDAANGENESDGERQPPPAADRQL